MRRFTRYANFSNQKFLSSISLCVLCDLCGKITTTEITEHTEKRRKSAHGVRFLFLIIFLLAACTSKELPQNLQLNTTELNGIAMDIPFRIVIGKIISETETSAIEKILAEVFEEVDAVFNNWNPNSEISLLNRLKVREAARLSPAMYDFLCRTDAVVRLTGGLFDPSIAPLNMLWKEKLQSGKIPSQNEINALVPSIGWDKIHFEKGLFSKDHDSSALDFGGNAKGHCVDMIVERLNAAGWLDLLVEWGGDMRASGTHPDNRPWRVFISRLGDNNLSHAIAEVDLIETALATSGDYLQNWSVKIDGKRVTYSHIIDPRTYFPLRMSHSSIASATIMASSCAVADALATAAMLSNNVGEGEMWIKQLQEDMPSLHGSWLFSRECQ